MPNHVAVVTDSTACLPEQLVAQWGITVVQVLLHVGERVDDERRFDREELVEDIRSGERVSTSPPDPGAFFWAYQDAMIAGASAVVSIHISERMSATVRAAREAADQVRIPVHVLDSETTGMSLGFAVLSAARAAGAGAPAPRVIEAAQRRYLRSAEFLYVDTLEYLRRGGRIGAAAAMVGTAFSIKPLLTVRGGEVAPLARVSGTRRALAKLVDLAVRQANHQPVDVSVAAYGRTGRELTILQQLRERIGRAHELIMVEASTVIGAHVGPGALSITVSPTS